MAVKTSSLLFGGAALAGAWYLLRKKKDQPSTEDGYTPKVPTPQDLPQLDQATRNHAWAYGAHAIEASNPYGVGVGRDGYAMGGGPVQTPGWMPTTLSLPTVCGTQVCPPGTACVQQQTSTACVYPAGTNPYLRHTSKRGR